MQCDAEFTYEQLEGATGCPTCGTQSLPMKTSNDVQLKINTHELRILTIWASNWAEEKCEPRQQKTLHCILQRISKQLPHVHLSFASEVKELQNSGVDATLIKEDGTVLVPRKDKPS